MVASVLFRESWRPASNLWIALADTPVIMASPLLALAGRHCNSRHVIRMPLLPSIGTNDANDHYGNDLPRSATPYSRGLNCCGKSLVASQCALVRHVLHEACANKCCEKHKEYNQNP